MNHGWQSESTNGLKGGWSCVLWSGYSGPMVAVVTGSVTSQLLDVVWCSAAVVVAVV